MNINRKSTITISELIVIGIVILITVFNHETWFNWIVGGLTVLFLFFSVFYEAADGLGKRSDKRGK